MALSSIPEIIQRKHEEKCMNREEEKKQLLKMNLGLVCSLIYSQSEAIPPMNLQQEMCNPVDYFLVIKLY